MWHKAGYLVTWTDITSDLVICVAFEAKASTDNKRDAMNLYEKTLEDSSALEVRLSEIILPKLFNKS